MKFSFYDIHTPEQLFFLIGNVVVLVCTFSIFLAVLIDFVEFQNRDSVKKEKKSIVETGTMFLFFFLFYALIRLRIGSIEIVSESLRIASIIIGSFILILGSYVNIKGRFDLGKNWANQIKIYEDHTFISKGVYRFIRHPLYASLIWIFFGASFIYTNYWALASNLLIFVPFMYYRAKQEERLLSGEFAHYKQYQTKVGMFFPKFIKKI